MKNTEKKDPNIKSLEDFDGDHKAYADYLESAECADDMGYDIYVDMKGNIFERTDGSWKNGHGHDDPNDPRPPRMPNDPKSLGRNWKNPWLIYDEKLSFNEEEIAFIFDEKKSKVKTLKK